jgi:hypothetical protein
MKEYKFKKFQIIRNGTIIAKENKKTWMSVHDNGMIYLSWELARVYFFLDKIDDNETITNVNLDKYLMTFSFDYNGEWEDWDNANGDKEVSFHFEVVFENVKDMDRFDKMVGKYLVSKEPILAYA